MAKTFGMSSTSTKELRQLQLIKHLSRYFWMFGLRWTRIRRLSTELVYIIDKLLGSHHLSPIGQPLDHQNKPSKKSVIVTVMTRSLPACRCRLRLVVIKG